MNVHGKSFFVRRKMENHCLYSEVIMLGSETEARGFLASITIKDSEGKVFISTTYHPRPISLEQWGQMGLVVTEKALSGISKANDKNYAHSMIVSVEKV